MGDRLWEAADQRVRHSSVAHFSPRPSGQQFGVAVVALRRGYQAYFVPSAHESIRAGDVFLVVGREERISQLSAMDVTTAPERRTITNFGLTLIEFILAPHSVYAGKTIKELYFRRRHGSQSWQFTAAAGASAQMSERWPCSVDASIAGPAGRVRELYLDPEPIIFETDPASRRVLCRRAVTSIVIFLSAVVLSIMGLPIHPSVLSAALIAVVTGFVSLRDAYCSIEWEIIVFVAGMHAVSVAMVNTGLAALVGHGAIGVFGNVAPLGLAAVAFIAAAAVTQFMGSQSTAFIIGPVAISAAIALDANPQVIAVATAIGCSAAFLTPIAHPVNQIMMGPGNHRFGDSSRSVES